LGGRLEALGSLTAGIAHEVNNPLAFIQANLSSLETTAKRLSEPSVRAPLPAQDKEAIDDLGAVIEETQEGVERIRILVQRLKTFSRTPDLTATAVEVDLERAAHQAAAIASIGQDGTPIEIEGTGALRVLTIETAVFQILVNLLLNAVQAQAHNPKIEVVLTAKNGGVSVRVSDDGPGIAPALLPRIFDPFFTTKAAGTGLGLSLSYDLANQLGGHLSAANRESGGAVFELWLPAIPPSTSPAAAGANDEPAENAAPMA
jgi:signal transduction histidine kinase